MSLMGAGSRVTPSKNGGFAM
jgi:hypothetical protein